MTDSKTETRQVVVERELAAPPDKVWRALTQPALLAEWLMQSDFQPIKGHRFKLHGDWGGVLDCKVLTIEPPTRLSYTWDLPHADPAYALNSVVTFTLTPRAAGTHLRMEQTGFRAGQRLAYGGARSGWPRFFDKLEQLLAREA